MIIITGSYAFVPDIFKEKARKGVFVYRTVKDLENIMLYAKKSKKAAVIGEVFRS